MTCSAFVVPADAFAQDRTGLYLRFGGGYGSAGVSCDGCSNDREHGVAVHVAAGAGLTTRLLVGVDLNLWTKQDEELSIDESVNFFAVTGTVTYYPSAVGFFVRGGVGGAFVNYDAHFDNARQSAELGQGLAAIAGAGYDIRISSRFSLTPAVNVWYGRIGTLRIGDETLASNWRLNVIDFTLGFSLSVKP